MPVARLLIAAVAAVCMFAAGSISAQPAPESGVTLKPARERGAPPETVPVQSESTANAQKLSLCIESWDAQTHMTKQEWRAACERSVRAQPEAFDR
jgi:hypothetical protein